MKPKTCRHRQAWPTIYNGALGYLWCPDCGATRQIHSIGESGFAYSEDRWIYPRGKQEALKQLDRVKQCSDSRPATYSGLPW